MNEKKLVGGMVLTENNTPDGKLTVLYHTTGKDDNVPKMEAIVNGVHLYSYAIGSINKSDFPKLKEGPVSDPEVITEILKTLDNDKNTN